MKETTEINLTPDPANPNRMDAETKAMMAKSLAEFGDLSGIVLNRRTGLLIGGHQRVSVLEGCTVEATDLPTPEPDGTVARGYVSRGGVRYSLRVVDWAEDKAHAALLAANRFGRVGTDDADLLKDLLQELDTGEMDMDLTGYTKEAIESLMTQFKVEDGRDGDRAGASPWDRVGAASEGVMFSFGDIQCRLSLECYNRFEAACPESEIPSWVEGVINACAIS